MIQIDYKLKKAADFESQGKNLHAVQIYTNLITENPEFPVTYLKLSALYEKMEKSDAAINLLRSYLDDVVDDNEIRLYLGQLLLKHAMWYDAVDVLSSVNPEDQPIVLFFLGFSNYMLKDFNSAKIYFDQFLIKNTSSEFYVETYLYLARINIELNLLEEALQCAQNAEEVSSASWELQLVFSMVYYHKGMYLHSVNSIEKAIKLNSNEFSLYEWAGKAYLKLGDYLKAEEYLLKYINHIDVSSEAYSYLGLACLNAQKLNDAKNYFDKALSIDPSNEIAIEGIKKCSQ